MREIIRVVILPLLLMGGILGIFYLIFGRRLREREDPPGVRTHATFGGFGAEGEAPATAGQAIAGKLHNALGDAGLDVNPVEPADYGWTVEVGAEDRGFAIRLGLLDEEPAKWLLYVDPLFASRGPLEDSAGLRRVLGACQRALESIGGREIRWHRREDHAAGHHERGAARPF